MNSYHGRTQQFTQFKIPLRIWVAVALAMGVLIALLIVLASVEI